MPSVEYDLVVVGAGLAGLALLNALCADENNHNLSIALVEAFEPDRNWQLPPAEVHSFEPRVSAVTPASVEFLQSLGVWENIVAQRVNAFHAMRVWDGEGTGAIAFDALELEHEQLGFIVENEIIVQALWAALAHRVDRYCPATVSEIQETGASRWLVSLSEKGDTDSSTTLNAGLLVAADGANSRLRTLADFPVREWSYQQRAIVCTVKTAEPHAHTAYQRFTAQGPLAFLPLAEAEERCSSIVWSVDDPGADDLLALSDAEFSQTLTQNFEARLGDVEAVSKRFSFPLQQRHATQYVLPGMALLGDAAHSIHPLAGQGANLGFSDARVLAQEIQRAIGKGLTPGDMRVLKRYQRRRMGDNLAMMVTVEGFKRLFSRQSLGIRALRGAGMSGLDRLPGVKHRIMREAMGL